MLITDTQKITFHRTVWAFSIASRHSEATSGLVTRLWGLEEGLCVQHKGSWVWPDFHNSLLHLRGFVYSLTPMYSAEMILHFVRWTDSRPWWPLVLGDRCWWKSWSCVKAAGISTAQAIAKEAATHRSKKWKPPQFSCPHCLESDVEAMLRAQGGGSYCWTTAWRSRIRFWHELQISWWYQEQLGLDDWECSAGALGKSCLLQEWEGPY